MPQIATKSLLEEQLKRGPDYSFSSTWPWKLLLFSVIILVVLFFIYLGMILGYGPYLDSQIASLNKQKSDLSNQIQSDQSQSLVNLYAQLVNTENLLQNHRMPSKLLEFIENTTDGSVYYTNLDFSVNDYTLQLTGFATDYNAVARQVAIFSQQPRVLNVFLNNAKESGPTDVQFSLKLILSPSLIKP